jgi:hypothetical protein
VTGPWFDGALSSLDELAGPDLASLLVLVLTLVWMGIRSSHSTRDESAMLGTPSHRRDRLETTMGELRDLREALQPAELAAARARLQFGPSTDIRLGQGVKHGFGLAAARQIRQLSDRYRRDRPLPASKACSTSEPAVHRQSRSRQLCCAATRAR